MAGVSMRIPLLTIGDFDGVFKWIWILAIGNQPGDIAMSTKSNCDVDEFAIAAVALS